MKKASEVFNKIRFAKLDPTHDKGPKGSTDDEEHGVVSSQEFQQQVDHVKKRSMQEKVNEPTGDLKDTCWKGYTAVGMKMKNGRKVPNCVPTNEQHADEGKFQPVKPKMIQNTPVVSPRPSNDSANVKLKEDNMDEDVKSQGQKAAKTGTKWWNNPHPSGSQAAYEWDKGHTQERTKLKKEETEKNFAGWIAHYNGQKHEIKKHEAKDLWDAKKKAIAHFKAPKSKHGLIGIAAAYNEEVEIEESRGHKIIDTFFKNRQAAKNQQTDHDKWKAEYKKARDAGSSSANAKARANGAVYEEQQIEEGEITRTKTGLVHRGTYGTSYSGKGSEAATQKDAKDLTTLNNKRTRNLEKGMDVHFGKSVDEGYYKDIDTNRKEDERLGSWKKETPWKKISGSGTVTDKSGAKHTPMSRARDLARAAMKKNIKEFVVTESRLADIVREAAESAKKKKKEAKEKDKDVSDDKFQKDPELSTQIIRND